MKTIVEKPGDILTEAKAHLRTNGWSLRRAAAELGRTHVHLSYVLNGRRCSRRLMERIFTLGKSRVQYRESGFARQTHQRRTA